MRGLTLFLPLAAIALCPPPAAAQGYAEGGARPHADSTAVVERAAAAYREHFRLPGASALEVVVFERRGRGTLVTLRDWCPPPAAGCLLHPVRQFCVPDSGQVTATAGPQLRRGVPPPCRLLP